jgi:hypothetical protein
MGWAGLRGDALVDLADDVDGAPADVGVEDVDAETLDGAGIADSDVRWRRGPRGTLRPSPKGAACISAG